MSTAPKSFCGIYWWIESETASAIDGDRLDDLIENALTTIKGLSRTPPSQRYPTQSVQISELRAKLKGYTGPGRIGQRPNPFGIVRIARTPVFTTDHKKVAFVEAVQSRAKLRLRDDIVACIQDVCANGMVRYGELCGDWVPPFPGSPVNSLSLLAEFLTHASREWFAESGRKSAELEGSQLQLSLARRDLLNSRHTLEWLRPKKEIQAAPDWPCEPQTAQEIYGQRAQLLRWIEDVQHKKPDQAKSGRKHHTPEEDEESFRIWIGWLKAKKQHRTRQEFVNQWNAKDPPRRISIDVLEKNRALFSKRIKEGLVPEKYKNDEAVSNKLRSNNSVKRKRK